MHDPRHPIRLSLLTLVMILTVVLCGCGSDSSNSPFNPNTTDQAPPVPPGGVRIAWEMQGKFALTWNTNTEPDLAGYRVYLYSPDPERGNAYACLTDELLTKSSFKVAWAGETSYIFRVTAVDASGNESPMSERLNYLYPTTIGTLPNDRGDGSAGSRGGAGSQNAGGGGSTRPDEQGGGGR